MSSEFSPELHRELLNDFYVECDELLTAIRRALSSLERALASEGHNRSAVEELYRSVHTLKGIAAIAGVQPAEQLAHAMEDVLRALTKHELPLLASHIGLLLDGARRLEQIIGAHKNGEVAPDHNPLAEALRRAAAENANEVADEPEAGVPRPENSIKQDPVEMALSRGLQPWRCTFAPSAALDRRGVNVNSVRERLGEIGEILGAEPSVRPDASIVFVFTVGLHKTPVDPGSWQADGILLEPITAPNGVPATPAAAVMAGRDAFSLSPSRIVRVDLDRLDELMRITGEMVIQRSRLEDRIQQQFAGQESLKEINLGLARSLRDLRKAITRVRLVPIAEIFTRMPFVVRDLMRGTEKRVRVLQEGEQTEIDKYLAERLAEPLLHLVRNAFAHGLELPAERSAAGKPVEATLLFRAATEGEFVVIQVRDDGRGIDREQIWARAEALGIPVPEHRDDNGLLRILSVSGFSTRETADRAAGRGIGMLVVTNAIRELGGTVSLQTNHGQGTTFTLRLPLTLSIVEAMIVSVGEETCAVPQRAITEIFQIPAAESRIIQRVEVVPYRDGLLPIVRLGGLFGLESQKKEMMTLLVVNSERGATGLLIDRVRSRREVVVRPLMDPLIRVQGVSGATELGDGKAILILDANALTTGVVRPHGVAGKVAQSDAPP